MTTILARIAAHHAKHIYKRGANKGDAPADTRGKSKFRVRKLADGTYAVHFHKTDIMVVNLDSTLTLNCDGYIEHPTTAASLNEALHKFALARITVSGKNSVMGYSQPIVHLNGVRCRYYDGMTLAVDPVTNKVTITSPLQPLKRKRIDAEKVAEFERGMEESGFKDAFKVLHAVSEPLTTHRSYPTPAHRCVVDAAHADEWPALIEIYTHESVWDYKLGRRVHIKRTAPDTWQRIMRECKKVMYEVVDSEHTEYA